MCTQNNITNACLERKDTLSLLPLSKMYDYMQKKKKKKKEEEN